MLTFPANMVNKNTSPDENEMSETTLPFLSWLKRESFRFADGLTLATGSLVAGALAMIAARHFGYDPFPKLNYLQGAAVISAFYLVYRTICAIVDYAIWAFFTALREFTGFSLQVLGEAAKSAAHSITLETTQTAYGETTQRGSAVAYLHDILNHRQESDKASPLTPTKED